VESERAIAALQAFAEVDAAPEALAFDRDLRAELIARVEPGTPLTILAATNDDEATRRAAVLIQQLRHAGRRDGLPDLGRSVRAWLGAARRPHVAAVLGGPRIDAAMAIT
jgi:streptomycin 6-kinase